jgi:hypothetical protein
MSLVPMDFSGEIKPLSAGTYAARIVAGEGKVSSKGNPMINWQLETYGSPEVNGKRIFYTTMTSGGWVSKLKELHKAATGEDIDKSAKQYDPEMLVSKEVTVTVVDESYTKNDGTQGTRLNVVSVAPAKK